MNGTGLTAIAILFFALGQLIRCTTRGTTARQVNSVVKTLGAEAVFASASLNIGNGLRNDALLATLITDIQLRHTTVMAFVFGSLILFIVLLFHARWMTVQYPNNYICPTWWSFIGQVIAYAFGTLSVVVALVLAW